MMFCEHPEKFFPVTRVDIVLFPEGSIENPDVMIEAPAIVGPVPRMISETLSYLRTNVIKKKITKPTDDEKSVTIYNYPYQAFEEAVVNALYHRDYREREPVEITIEPTHIDILSHSGPDRSISNEAIKAAKRLKTRRYRNRRLGDFLKELELTEGRATGIPTIQKALRENGSSAAIIETDEDRTFFMMTIPCREGFEESVPNSNDYDEDGFDQELLHILGHASVKVQEAVNQCETANKTLLGQILLQMCVKVWVKSKSNVDFGALSLSVIDTLLLLKNQEANAATLFETNESVKPHEYRRRILNPLIQEGYITMTLPDKPRSSKQTYKLSDKGLALFEGK